MSTPFTIQSLPAREICGAPVDDAPEGARVDPPLLLHAARIAAPALAATKYLVKLEIFIEKNCSVLFFTSEKLTVRLVAGEPDTVCVLPSVFQPKRIFCHVFCIFR
jgi:hypothetical protein